MASVRQFSLLPNKTSTQIFPIGSQDNPGTITWKVVLVGSSMFMVMPNLSIVSLYMMLMLLPSSINTFEKFTLISGPMNVRSRTRAYPPRVGMILGRSFILQVISCSDQCMYLGIAGIVAFTSIIR